MTEIKTETDNIKTAETKTKEEEFKPSIEFNNKLIDMMGINFTLGIISCVYNNVGKPVNVPTNTDLLKYTVEDAKDAFLKNVNGWMNSNLDKIYGIYLLTGKIRISNPTSQYYKLLDGKYLVGIETDTEQAYHAFLNGSTIEEIVSKYKWVIHHTEPYYKIHIFIIVNEEQFRKLSFLNENIIVNQQTKQTLGYGVFTQGKWFADSPSVNHRTNYAWELFENGNKVFGHTSDDVVTDLIQRSNHVCKSIGGFEYGKQTSQEYSKQTNQEYNKSQQQTGQQSNTEQEEDQEFDTPTTNFIKYVVSCLLPYYVIPNRDKIVFSLSGMFAKEGVPIKVTKKIIEILMEKTGDTDTSRIPTLINSYKKNNDGMNVEGFSTIRLYLGEELAKEFDEKVDDYLKFSREIFRIQDLYEVATLYLISQKPMITFQDSLEDKKPEILIYDEEKGYFSKEKDFTEIVYEVYSFDFKPYEYEYLRFYVKNNTKVKRSDCDKDLKLINVEDGMYNYVTGELLDHDPKYLSIFQYPVRFGNYDPAKKCVRFLKFFSESVAEQDQENLLNSFSYIAYRHNIKEKINFMIGEGSNGKSVLLNGIRKYVYGEENIGNLSIDRIRNDPFSLHKLVGKHANFAPDIREINSSGDLTFMKLLSGDTPIEIEEKYKNLKEIALNIKQFYCLNRLGKIPDDSDATLRRLNISNFPQKFKDELTPEEELDPLHEYKLADTELIELFKEEKESIFFGEFMTRLKNLYEKKFKFGNSANQNRARYNILNDILKIWKEKRIRFTKNFTDRFEFTKDLDESLYNFCKKHNVPKPHKDAMCKDLYKEINFRHKNEENKDTFKPRIRRKRVFQNSEEDREWAIGGLYCLDEDQSKEGEEDDF